MDLSDDPCSENLPHIGSDGLVHRMSSDCHVPIPNGCEFCGGKLDVPCFSGAKLRCGCGKAVIDAPASPAQSDAAVEALLALLRKHGVSRFEGYGISVAFRPQGMVIGRQGQKEYQPLAVAAESAIRIPQIPPDEEACTCGHKILTDHSPTGCLHGCDIETCGRQGTAGDDA